MVQALKHNISFCTLLLDMQVETFFKFGNDLVIKVVKLHKIRFQQIIPVCSVVLASLRENN
jgi:hypothetical protein